MNQPEVKAGDLRPSYVWENKPSWVQVEDGEGGKLFEVSGSRTDWFDRQMLQLELHLDNFGLRVDFTRVHATFFENHAYLWYSVSPEELLVIKPLTLSEPSGDAGC